MNVLSHFPNFIFPSEVLSCAINYLLKVAFSKLGFSQASAMVSFLKVAKNKLRLILHYSEYLTLLMCFVFYF